MKKRYLLSLPAAALLATGGANAQSVNPELNQAASKVDLAGSYVELNRVDGDIKLLTEYLELIVEVARKNGEDIPENFDVSKLISALGLDTLQATAMSNTQKGDIWLNKAYLQTDGKSAGIFSLIGEPSKEFTIPAMCPKGTDLALQLTLDLRQMPTVVRDVAKSVGMQSQLDSEITKQIPELGLSIEDFLKKSNITLNLAIDLDETEKLDLGENKMPRPHLVARADGLAWLWEKFGDEMIQQSQLPLQKSEKDGVITYSVPEDLAAMLQGYSPVIVVDKAKDQVWVASSAAFLTKAQTAGQQLKDDPAFQASWQDMPATGNSMAYISKNLVTQLHELYQTAEKEGLLKDEDFQNAKPLIDKVIADLTKPQTGYVFAFGNDGSGIQLSNKTPFPAKYSRYLQTIAPLIEKFSDESCELELEVEEQEDIEPEM